MQQSTNTEMIKTVLIGLGELVNEVVFVGGAITELYVENKSQISEVRPTDDVDCIIEITSRKKYADLEDQLRKQKFENDRKIICRWHYQGVIVDIMPTDETILGFSNRWYSEGIAHSITYEIEKNKTIKLLAIPYFIGCKLEALFNRGMSDLRLSKDLEDIVFLLNYGVKVNTNNKSLKEYISNKFEILLSKPELREAISCVLPYGENETEYVDQIIKELINYVDH
jgi:predicted nucleotidyltransferase